MWNLMVEGTVVATSDEAPRYDAAGGWRIGDVVYADPGHAMRVVLDARAAAKAERHAAVDAIAVTVGTGKVFDGDEVAQTRMARAIIGLQAAGVPSIRWTLADNSSVEVTLAELTEALILAGQEQARLWEIPAWAS